MKKLLIGSFLSAVSGIMLATSTAIAAPNLSFCYDKVKGNSLPNVKVGSKQYNVSFKGTICAVKPSVTALKNYPIKDVGSNPKLGFGYHAIGVPDNLNANTPVLFHFTGSYGRAYDQSVRNGDGEIKKGDFPTRLFLGEAINKGFLVIQLAYANDKSVNGDLCNPSLKPKTTDWCSARAREEILVGYDAHDLIKVDSNNGWQNRLKRLLYYLRSKKLTLPTALNPDKMDWKLWSNFNKFAVSGHSQGGGHAHYIAKYVRMKSACLISGGYDQADLQNPKNIYADWINDTTKYATSKDAFGGVAIKGEDGYDAFTGMYEDFLKMTKGIDYFTSGNKDYHNKNGELITDLFDPSKPNPHGAAIGALELKNVRNKACFVAPID